MIWVILVLSLSGGGGDSKPLDPEAKAMFEGIVIVAGFLFLIIVYPIHFLKELRRADCEGKAKQAELLQEIEATTMHYRYGGDQPAKHPDPVRR